MILATYGGGTNSSAALIEWAKRGLPLDIILFADTGGEKPHTYRYVKIFSDWLVSQGYPAIITVKRVNNKQNVEMPVRYRINCYLCSPFIEKMKDDERK